jgi:hypothetical protein
MNPAFHMSAGPSFFTLRQSLSSYYLLYKRVFFEARSSFASQASLELPGIGIRGVGHYKFFLSRE